MFVYVVFKKVIENSLECNWKNPAVRLDLLQYLNTVKWIINLF